MAPKVFAPALRCYRLRNEANSTRAGCGSSAFSEPGCERWLNPKVSGYSTIKSYNTNIKHMLKYCRDIDKHNDCWLLCDDDYVPAHKKPGVPLPWPHWTYRFGTHSGKKTWVEMGELHLMVSRAPYMDWLSFATKAKWSNESMAFYYAMRSVVQTEQLKMRRDYGDIYANSFEGYRDLSRFMTERARELRI